MWYLPVAVLNTTKCF